MKEYYKRRYCLSEQGAKNLSNATWSCFFTYCINIAPMIILMMFLDNLLLKNERNIYIYIGISVLTLIIMYFLLSKEYINLYNTTYKESANIRIDIAHELSKIPLSFFQKRNLSDFSNTIMSDVERIEHAMSHSIPKVVGMMIFFPIIGGMMIIGNYKLGIAAIIPTLISFVLIPLSRNERIKANTKYHDILTETSDMFQETIEMQEVISSYNLSKEVKTKLYKKMEDNEKIHMKLELGAFIITGISNLFAFISIAVVIIVGIILLKKREISLLYLLGYVIGSFKIKELFDISKEGILEMYYIEPAIARIKELKNMPIQTGEDIAISKYDIELRNVSFSYNDDCIILKNINFIAKQGEVTALVGASGSGKTSILRLISRLYDCDKGSVLIDGKDVKTIAIESLFDKISIVFQDVTLFNTSVFENIRLGRENVSKEDVIRAAKLANCMDFIEKLPNGFDTKIGENGTELSGGERQRLSIARAFLKDSPILILDEISASLDVDNEEKIQESLNKLIKNKTVIVISHRLKSIENVDKIVVIDDGYVESIGKHNELVKKSKVYRNLIEKTKLAEAFVY